MCLTPRDPFGISRDMCDKKVYERGSAEVIVDTDTDVSKDLM